jgi:hypothetical protein
MLLEFKHNLDEFAKDVLYALTNRIRQSKKDLHQKAADIVKKDIKENVYPEEFQKVVNPDSRWQRLKAELGFPSKPGYFTGSTLDALMTEVTEEMGQVLLAGEWPDRKTSMTDFMNRIRLTSSGLIIGPLRNDRLGIRIGELLIPTEAYASKQYGSWIAEDIVFMKIRPEAERDAVAEVEQMLADIIAKGSK